MIVKAICINNSYTTDDIIPSKNHLTCAWNTRRIPCTHPHLVVGEWYQFDVKNGHDKLYPQNDNEYHMLVPGGITVACGYIFSDKIKDEKYKFSKFFITAKEWRQDKLDSLV